MAYRPMLAETGSKPFDDPAWAFEPKWDGVRVLSYGGRLVARSGRDLTQQFPEVARELTLLGDAVLDGEIVVLDGQGKPSFPLVSGRVHLQNRILIGLRAMSQPATYFAFDILERQGESQVRRLLEERRNLLVGAIRTTDHVKLTPQLRGKGVELFTQVRERAMEGIMAKRLESFYQPGVRSRDWLKVKVSQEGEFVVIGATLGEGRREGLMGALVLAEETAGGLSPVGEVGTGFSDEELQSLTRVLQGMKADRPRCIGAPVERLWFWTEPRLRVKVSYLERTEDGRLRFPVYRGEP